MSLSLPATGEDVVIVVNDLAFARGGGDRIALATAVGLAEAGVTTVLFCARCDDCETPAHPNLRTVATGQALLRDEPSTWRAVLRGLWNGAAARLLERTIREYQSSGCRVLVHVHGYTKCLSVSVFHAAARARVPVVLTLHDFFAFSPNGLHFDFRSNRVLAGRPSAWFYLTHNLDREGYVHHLFRLARFALQRTMKLIPDSIAGFIAVSDRSREFASQYLAPDRITTIHNPITFERQAPATPAQNEILLYVGRIVTEKGVLALAEAARGLDMPLVMVGEGIHSEEVSAVNADVTITGWVPHDEVETWLRRARGVVLPSFYLETFGLTIAEAMSHGVPVLVTHRAGVSDWIDDGESGLVWEGDNAATLRPLLLRFADDGWVESAGHQAYQQFWAKPRGIDTYARQLRHYYSHWLSPVSTL